MRQERGFGMQWHQLDHMQTICTSLQTDNNTTPHHSNVYRLEAFPDAQPTNIVIALKASTLTFTLIISYNCTFLWH